MEKIEIIEKEKKKAGRPRGIAKEKNKIGRPRGSYETEGRKMFKKVIKEFEGKDIYSGKMIKAIRGSILLEKKRSPIHLKDHKRYVLNVDRDIVEIDLSINDSDFFAY